MMDYEADDSALKREWLAARIVVLFGFVIAIAVAVYFAYFAPEAPLQRQASIPGVTTTPQQTAMQERVVAAAAYQMCRIEVATAQSRGFIPVYSRLADPSPKATNSQGRYACSAATPVAKYTIEADLVCRNLNDVNCVKLYS